MTPDELRSHVDTIVVVMMENRSFDHVLGYLGNPAYGNRSDIDGIADLASDAYVNINVDGQAKHPFWMPDGPLINDPPHDSGGTTNQMKYSAVAGRYLMTGFVETFENRTHARMTAPPVMGLLRPSDLPTTSVLADHYCVCDRWFASVPSSTQPNRLMALCGVTPLRDLATLLPDLPTVYDWLSAHGVRWRVYAAGLPFFLMMPRLIDLALTDRVRRLGALAHDLATDPADQRPQVIFIEPDYYDSPVHLQPPCDNHAPLAVAPGEAFLAEVYQALAHSPLWGRSVLVLSYDEHGGFFDHVPPLAVGYRDPGGTAFTTTGPRVPAIVAGPYAPRGASHIALDHTSILQLLAERFGKPGESYSAAVDDRRRQGIHSVSELLAAGAGNTASCQFIAPRAFTVPSPASPPELRPAFDAAFRALVANHPTEALRKYPELAGYRAH